MDEIITSIYMMRTPSNQKLPFASDQISLQLHLNCMIPHGAYCYEDEIIGSSSGFSWIQTFSWEGHVAVILNL